MYLFLITDEKRGKKREKKERTSFKYPPPRRPSCGYPLTSFVLTHFLQLHYVRLISSQGVPRVRSYRDVSTRDNSVQQTWIYQGGNGPYSVLKPTPLTEVGFNQESLLKSNLNSRQSCGSSNPLFTKSGLRHLDLWSEVTPGGKDDESK